MNLSLSLYPGVEPVCALSHRAGRFHSQPAPVQRLRRTGTAPPVTTVASGDIHLCVPFFPFHSIPSGQIFGLGEWRPVATRPDGCRWWACQSYRRLYTFTISDAYGDICCSCSNGSYSDRWRPTPLLLPAALRILRKHPDTAPSGGIAHVWRPEQRRNRR